MEGISPIDEYSGSSTKLNQHIIETALRAADPSFSHKAKNQRSWRANYVRHYENVVRASLQSHDKCLSLAEAGLEELYRSFEFVRGDESISLDEIAAQPKKFAKRKFHVGHIPAGIQKPKGVPPSKKVFVPYNEYVLREGSLAHQMDVWSEYGTIEPTAAEAVRSAISNPQWLNEPLDGKCFVLLGASSAMGPLKSLLSLGAHVVAIDINRPHVWKKMIHRAKYLPGSLTFPLSKPQSELKTTKDLRAHAGCDLLTEFPDVLAWVSELYPDKELVVGSYVYLDGLKFVCIALATDVIVKGLCLARPSTSIAFLNSPTGVFGIPNEARDAAKSNWDSWGWRNVVLTGLRNVVSEGTLVPNALPSVKADDGTTKCLCDGLFPRQGPNYALAKVLQVWRCFVARSRGHIASSNVAPATYTKSVTSNKLFKVAYDGASFFKPVEIFQQKTSKHLMTAILLYDLFDPASPANPETPLNNPYDLIAHSAVHGGVWRMGYKFGSSGEIAAAVKVSAMASPGMALLAAMAVVGVFVKSRHRAQAAL